MWSCHCGRVHLEIAHAPDAVNECQCSICQRYAATWAYYSPTLVRISPPTGATDIYMWGDRRIEFHRCKGCGCLTHWEPADKSRDRMGVNTRLMEPDVVASARRYVNRG
jgi:hypothetical protein